jgi:flagellar basal body-associated protein FliL
MADKDKKDKAPEKGADKASESLPAKKGLPVKTLGIVAALMLVEGVGLFFVLGALGGPKASNAATDPKQLVHDTSEETMEIQLLEKEDERFQNLSSGQVWVWNVSVWVQVKSKNEERVNKVLEKRHAEIKEGLSQLVGRAQISQLKEPERQSLNRQVTALLEKIIGQDSEGKPLVERVLIPTCSGYPASY